MKGKAFILSIIKKLESLVDGMVVYAYKECSWYSICLSDYDYYFHNQRFKTLSKAWHKAAVARGFKISFAYCNPLESKLKKLADEDNLIINVV